MQSSNDCDKLAHFEGPLLGLTGKNHLESRTPTKNGGKFARNQVASSSSLPSSTSWAFCNDGIRPSVNSPPRKTRGLVRMRNWPYLPAAVFDVIMLLCELVFFQVLGDILEIGKTE